MPTTPTTDTTSNSSFPGPTSPRSNKSPRTPPDGPSATWRPSSTDLINVRLDLRSPHTYMLYAVSGSLLWIMAAFTTGIPAVLTIERVLTRRRRQA